ncbi:MAG TPA: cytochrome c peroxidase [Candidatus Acidoferrales bacterium]|nr:cytochrome c peroxidase [Candidatus Acidoferrales bacterium]
MLQPLRGAIAVAAGFAATAALAVALCAAASHVDDRSLYTPAQYALILNHSPLGPVPPDPTDRLAGDPRAARFGQYLFFDTGFSPNGEVSCSSCHQPARSFTDGRALAKGLGIEPRHTPTLLNAAYNHWYFWDGRTDSQWSQALQPLENPLEVGTDRLHVLHAIADDAQLRTAYTQIFGPLPPLANQARFPAHARPDPDPKSALARAWAHMTPQDRTAADRAYSNLGKAIEAYERKLVGSTSPFDHYVAALRADDVAEEDVIAPAAKRGLKIFVSTGNCELCHAGPDFSDGQFHNIGLPLLPGEAADTGRAAGIRLVRDNPFNAAGRFSDDRSGQGAQQLEFLSPPASQLGAFKTPSLRNVAAIAPYMHDGRFATLAQVLDFYARGKAASRGRLVGVREQTTNLIPHLTAAQQSDLIAFLRTLTNAPLPAALLHQPATP